MGEASSGGAPAGGEPTTDDPGYDPSDAGTNFSDLPDEVRSLLEERSHDGDLSLDEIFELLKNRRRRDVIGYLRDVTNGPATLSDLAEFIAAKENDIEVHELSSDQRKRVYIGLYQCHLPKMNDMGVIDFENNRGTVELKPAVEQLEPYLQRTAEQPAHHSPMFELALTGLVLLALATAIAGIGPIASLPPVAWAAMSTVALIIVAAYHVVYSR
ncbi:MAG: DUF7344 domain-containing protein [Halobacteriota archaeon]